MASHEPHTLCLEPLTVLDIPAEEGVALAAACDIPLVGLWVQSPSVSFAVGCLVEDGPSARKVRETLAATGIKALNLEVFDLTPSTDVGKFRPALELGASLGARSATAIFRDNPDPSRRTDQFAALCALGKELGVRINVEFIAARSVGTLEQAADLVRAAGQTNAGIVVDVLHLVRSQGTPDQVRRLDPRLVGHAQLCDGPIPLAADKWPQESGGNRLAPGEGDFPIREFIAALPPMPIGIEVPHSSEALRGLSAAERVRRLAAATRRFVESPTAHGR